MAFQLNWMRQASNDWNRLDGSARKIVAKKLNGRLVNPHVAGDRLFGNLSGCYRLKFKKLGLRLVYTVIDNKLEVLVIAVGNRADGEVYELAEQRLLEFKDNGHRPLG